MPEPSLKPKKWFFAAPLRFGPIVDPKKSTKRAQKKHNWAQKSTKSTNAYKRAQESTKEHKNSTKKHKEHKKSQKSTKRAQIEHKFSTLYFYTQ